jgi:hypothetical protein
LRDLGGGRGHRRLPVFWVRRGGARIMVRANRYALAAAHDVALEPWV